MKFNLLGAFAAIRLLFWPTDAWPSDMFGFVSRMSWFNSLITHEYVRLCKHTCLHCSFLHAHKFNHWKICEVIISACVLAFSAELTEVVLSGGGGCGHTYTTAHS